MMNVKLIPTVAIIAAFIVGIVVASLILFHGHGSGGSNVGGIHTNSTKAGVRYNYSVNIAMLPGIGQYIVNSSGRALYMYVPDTPNSGKSACYGECIAIWSVFYAQNLTAEPGINSSLFGTITRTGGIKQTTFNGYPLYYYEYDTGPGSINGQDFGGIWYVMSSSGQIIKNTT